MKRIVLDTNCLLMCIPKNSPYRIVWDAFLNGEFILCLSNEIVEEYQEILSNKTTTSIASNVISTILNQHNIELITPYYRFGLIQADADDNLLNSLRDKINESLGKLGNNLFHKLFR